METFTPLASLVGGVLIGLSAGLVMLVHGRIAGISGIWGSAWHFTPGDFLWRATFAAGLLMGGAGVLLFLPEQMLNTTPRTLATTAVAGLLVGVGTRLGGGCTSGHGVCGNARFSPRSVVATVTFIAAGALTAWLGQHLLRGVL